MTIKNRFSELRKRVKFLRAIAWTVSIIFNPLILPTYFFALVAGYAPIVFSPIAEETLDNLLLVVFLSTFLMPLLILISMYYLFKRGAKTKDFLMENRKERTLPFMFTGTYYMVLGYMLFSQLNEMLFIFMLGIGALIVTVTIINIFWKISAHAVGISGIAGFILATAYIYPASQLLIPLILVILFTGVVMSARLFLNSHTPSQIFAGAFLGFAGSIFSVYILLNL